MGGAASTISTVDFVNGAEGSHALVMAAPGSPVKGASRVSVSRESALMTVDGG